MKSEMENVEEISLSDLLAVLWSYRAKIVISLLVTVALLMSVLLVVYVRTPNQRSASLPFRILFEGAENGKYPNDLKFSPSDIVSAPVIEQVYTNNDLLEYLTFEEFKGALFVYESNAALTMLDKEYQQKLSNSKLSAVDRQTLEAEYQEKRQSLRNASYELKFFHSGGLFELPQVLIDKVLKEVLVTWARVADEQKGGFKYRIPVYTRNILPPSLLEKQDYIVSIDVFKNKIDQIIDNIEEIKLLPGAQVARVGEQRIGLEEILLNLMDTRRFKLEPLIGLIRNVGLSKDVALSLLYLENKLFQLNLKQKEAKNKIAVLENSLSSYLEKTQRIVSSSELNNSSNRGQNNGGRIAATYIPQFGDSFLDRVVEMSTQGNDAEFRQEITARIVEEGLGIAEIEKEAEYYNSLISAMRNVGDKDTATYDTIVTMVKTSFSEINQDLIGALDDINAIYTLISKNNLRPETELYTITNPLSLEGQQAFMSKKVLLAGTLFFMLSVLVTLLGCFVHHALSKVGDDK
ncbi:MAG: hypothetical protein J7K75_01815 [Desulfuromonas sp.]|nr:hypothetical protein [Desulfuromonas sp.]